MDPDPDRSRVHIVTFDRKKLGRRRQWYFRIVAGNGEPIAASEGYFNGIERDYAAKLAAGPLEIYPE